MTPPKPAIMWPLTISAGVNDRIDFNRGGVKAATIAAATYYTPAALVAAVQAALTAADGAVTWTVSVNASGRVVVGGTSSFVLLFATGAGAATSARYVLGFGAVDTASATTATAQNQHQNGWYASDPVVDDTGDRAIHERSQTVALSGKVRGSTHATRYRRVIVLGALPAWKVWTEEEGSTYLNEALERLHASGWSRFRWFADQTALAVGTDYALDLKSADTVPRDRLSPGAALYSLTLQFRKYV